MNKIAFILLSMMIFFSRFSSAEDVLIGYPEFKPYTYTQNGQPAGIGVKLVRAIEQELNKSVKFIPIQTYKNGLTRLQHHKIDILLMATQNEERDKIAVFSKPIAVNNWSWFSLKQHKFDYHNDYNRQNLKIVTYDNANTHKWLVDKQYGTIYTTTDITAMLRQLATKRVDAIFLSEAVLLDALDKSSLTLDDLQIQLQVAQPMGLYVNKNYAQHFPHFMRQLNIAIERVRDKSTLP